MKRLAAVLLLAALAPVPLAALQAPPATGWLIQWVSPGQVLLGGSGLVATVELESGAEALVDDLALAAALAPSGRLLALAHAEEIELRCFPGGQLVGAIPVGYAVALAWSPDGGILAVGTEDGHLLLWDLISPANPCAAPAADTVRGEPWADLEIAPPAGLTRVAFASAGPLLSVYADGRAVVWDVRERAVRQQLDPARDAAGQRVRQARIEALAPDGERVLATEVEDDRPVARLLAEGRPLWRHPGRALEFSPDGADALLLAADARAVLRVSAAAGRTTQTFAPPANVRELYFARLSPDGRHLLAVGEDTDGEQLLVLWDATSGAILKVHR